MGHTKLLLVMVFSILVNKTLSQKFSSKFFTSPILLNPANTGRFIGDYRFGGISRTEINTLSSDLTYFFSFDSQILKNITVDKDRFSLGVAALSESDHFLGLFNKSFIASLAYFKGLDEDGLQQLGIGFQTSFSTKRRETPTYIFPEQVINAANTGFTGLNFDPRSISVNYFDFNAGLNYQNYTNSKNLFSAGISILHLTRPYKKFDAGEFTIHPEACFQTSLETSLSERNKLLTNFSINVNTDTRAVENLSLGCIYQLAIGQGVYKISGGSFFRNDNLYGPAVSPSLGLKFVRCTILMSYDIDLHKQQYNKKNTFELGMTVTGMYLKKKQ